MTEPANNQSRGLLAELKRSYEEGRQEARQAPRKARRQLIWVTVGVGVIVFIVRSCGLFDPLTSGQVRACKADADRVAELFGTAYSFDDYDFSEAKLTGAYKVNRSADDFTNYMYEVPSRDGKRHITCGIYKRDGTWVSVNLTR